MSAHSKHFGYTEDQYLEEDLQQLATLQARLALAEAVVEAADRMRDEMYSCNGGNCGANPEPYDAARAALDRSAPLEPSNKAKRNE